MKPLVIVVAIVVILLVAGAIFRLSTMTADTKPLFGLGLVRSSDSGQVDKPSAETSAKQRAIARQLRGNAWEQEGAVPSESELSEQEEFRQGDEVLEQREEDLQNAKKKMNILK